jgi:hypothetical protein
MILSWMHPAVKLHALIFVEMFAFIGLLILNQHGLLMLHGARQSRYYEVQQQLCYKLRTYMNPLFYFNMQDHARCLHHHHSDNESSLGSLDFEMPSPLKIYSYPFTNIISEIAIAKSSEFY